MQIDSAKLGGSRIMKASEFKAKCLQLMDEVAAGGAEVVITKNGRPVSRLVPYLQRPQTLLGIDKGRVRILGEVVEPIDGAWEAETDPERVLTP